VRRLKGSIYAHVIYDGAGALGRGVVLLRLKHDRQVRLAYNRAAQGQAQRAIASLDNVLTVSPNYARGYFARGLIESQLDPVKSLTDLESAAIILSREGRLIEFFVVLEHLAQAPNTLFARGSDETSGTRPYLTLDSAGRSQLDIFSLCSEPAQALVKEMISNRFTGSVERSREMRRAVSLTPLLAPINPLLFCTALAKTLVTERDDSLLLVRYMEGVELPPIHSDFLAWPRYQSDDLLARHLRLEDDLVAAFCILSLQWIAAKRFDVTVDPQVATSEGWDVEWSRLTTAADRGDGLAMVDREAVLWGTWLLANPALFWLDHESAQRLLWKEGFATNSQIHEARHEAERLATEDDRRFNQMLRQNSEAAVKKSALEGLQTKRALGRQLLMRGRRFYLWNPCEIDARWHSEALVNALYGPYDDQRFEDERGIQ
jgi:hypothetical protein